MDFFVQRNNGRPVLAMSDMVMGIIDAKEFDRLSPPQVTNYEGLRNNLAANFRPSVQAVLGGAYGGPAAAVFQTRYGVDGMFRVDSISSDPPGITFRYKLVQNSAAQRDLSGEIAPQTAQPPSPGSLAGPNNRLSFSDSRGATFNEAHRLLFLSLRTLKSFPAYAGKPSGFEQWKKANAIDLALEKNRSGEPVVRNVNLMMAKTNGSAWATITPKQVLGGFQDEGEALTNNILEPSATYAFMTSEFGIGVLQLAASPENPGSLTVNFKSIKAPVEFGPVIERVINLSGPANRALNLGSQNYVPLPPNAPLRFSQTGDPTLVNSGIDIIATTDTNSPSALVALDMRSFHNVDNEQKDVPPNFRDPWARVEDYTPVLWWVETHVFDLLDLSKPEDIIMSGVIAADNARRAKGYEDAITSTNVCTFTTRDGTEGILQIVPTESDTVKLRYRLVQPKSDGNASIPLQPAGKLKP